LKAALDTGRQLQIKKKGRMDFPLFLITVLLSAFGILMLFSASYYYAQKEFGDGLFYVKKQMIGFVIGFVALGFLANFDYHKLEKFKVPALLGALVLLVLVLIVGANKNGATRWLDIGGVSVQPAEIAKFAMMLYMCSFMARRQELMPSFTRGVVPLLMIIGIVCLPILLQPNFSTVVSTVLLGFTLIAIGGSRLRQIAVLGVAGVVVMVPVALSADYRMDRFLIFTDPWKDAADKGYQLVQSLYALGSGGLFGKGLNYSREKLLFLPYGESDFIFSIIAEELGFIGAMLLLAAYAFLIYRGIRIALKCNDLFGSLMAMGVTMIIAIQVIINVGVVTSSIPPTGVTLPFISAGLSSLIVFLAAMGVLLNISRNTT
jgi:cell division protein FtsW